MRCIVAATAIVIFFGGVACAGPVNRDRYFDGDRYRASAQKHSHPPQDAEIHERFYNGWMRPDKPSVSCCNLMDCYPTEARFQSGTWFAKRREDGKWLTVPASKIEQNRDSPDGRNHLCAPKPQYENAYENGVICFIAGGGT